jgi:hypothetical protein
MVRTRTFEELNHDSPEGSLRRGRRQVPRGGAPPPPPVSLEQLLATQNDLMRRLVKNDECRGAERQQPRTRTFWQYSDHDQEILSFSQFRPQTGDFR